MYSVYIRYSGCKTDGYTRTHASEMITLLSQIVKKIGLILCETLELYRFYKLDYTIR